MEVEQAKETDVGFTNHLWLVLNSYNEFNRCGITMRVGKPLMESCITNLEEVSRERNCTCLTNTSLCFNYPMGDISVSFMLVNISSSKKKRISKYFCTHL